MKNDNTYRVIDKLEGTWKDVYTFLCNNKGVEGLDLLTCFTGILSRFKFDESYIHRGKKIFIHHQGEWDYSSYPWQPCERAISFESSDKKVTITITAKKNDETLAVKQVLTLEEDKNGNYTGCLAIHSEKFGFKISKHGYVKDFQRIQKPRVQRER